jgi:Transposase DDE domain
MESLSALLTSLRRCCEALPDLRRPGPNTRYAMADFGLAAFSVFFMQSPSFLAHQRHLERGQGRSNCQTLFGMAAIPCDNQIRAMLDPVDPSRFFPVVADVVGELERTAGLKEFRRLDGRILIALDGTEYFRSNRLHCAHCSSRARGGKTEYFHTMLSAVVVAPGHQRVVPLEPEFIVPQDGHDKQDCESRAARRWLDQHAGRYARFDPVYLGDDLYARQPVCEAVRAANGHFLFVAKPSSHATIEAYLTGVELPVHTERVKRGRERFTSTYRWLCDVPLRGDGKAMSVNWLMIEIANPKGAVTYRNSFITDLPVARDTVAELAACGRARWKIENETFNVLKTRGYNLGHNFGHGQRNLSAVLATLNLLAFACHTVCELAETTWNQAVQRIGARRRFFEHLRTLTVYLVFLTWDDLLATIVGAAAPQRPP